MSMLASSSWLVDTAAAVTLLIALVLAVRVQIGRLFGPGIAYALWLLPLARTVMPGITLSVAPTIAGPPAHVFAASSAAVPELGAVSLDAWPMVVALWIGGAALLAVHAMRATWHLRRAILADGVLIEWCGRVCILSSHAVASPLATGIIHPLIVLPADFAQRFTPLQRRQVIAHELAHHRAHDLLITLVGFGLLALNWFNPIAWVGWRAFRQDQEAACDARALASLSADGCDDRAAYGRAIAAAATGHAVRTVPVLSLTMGEKSAILHRLRSLAMTHISPRRRYAGRMLVFGAALLALPMTATVSYAVEQADPPAPPPNVTVISGGAPYERRIERDGRTIILRSTQPLSDAEIATALAEADAAGASTTAQVSSSAPDPAGERRVIIRTRTVQSNSTSSTDAEPATSADGGRPGSLTVEVNGHRDAGPARSEMTFVFGGAPGMASRTSCDSDPAASRIERTSGSGDQQHVLRLIRCGASNSPAARVESLRRARAAFDSVPTNARMPEEARTSLIAELDRLIAEETQAQTP